MSNLEELIERLCPDGVEYKPLWSVTAWDKKFNAVDRSMQPKTYSYHVLLAKDLFAMKQETGDVFLLSTGVETGWTTEEIAGDFMCEGEVVTIPWGKSSPVKGLIKYYNGKFVTGDNRIATSLNTDVLDNKYLYYWMVNNGEAIDKFYRGSGIKHPSMYDVLTMKLPVPPLEVQREIVRILDNFTFLTTELAAELAARQKQYEYYRNSLLTFEDIQKSMIKSIPWVKLDNIIEFKNGKGHEKCINENGQYIVVNSKFISTNGRVKKFSDQQLSPLYNNDILMVMSDLPNGQALAKTYLVKENSLYTLNQRICALTVKNKNYSTKFLFYYLNRNKQLLKYDNGVDQTNLKKGDILTVIVPVISLAEQQRIVDILDRFDTLCNDISSGLPAEIEARQKQYEYYRDKLLNFKELKKEA